jgi:hypothetical protein
VLHAVQELFHKELLTGKTTHATWREKPSFYAVSIGKVYLFHIFCHDVTSINGMNEKAARPLYSHAEPGTPSRGMTPPAGKRCN